MLMTPRNPASGIYPATDYVHAMEVTGAQRLLFVSGTMGLDGQGNAPEGLEHQLALIWSNISRILAEANMTTENIVRVTSHLRHADFAVANARARLEALGERRIPTTVIVVETLLPEWLVEIEAIAAS
jgi:enamine deaminase RidA (YjgF/YER057c/UK114 family)